MLDMEKEQAIQIIQKACKTKKQKEAFESLFGMETHLVKTPYKCNYHHEICSRCMEWPLPEDIKADNADDCCNEYEIAAHYFKQEEVAKTGKCKYFMER